LGANAGKPTHGVVTKRPGALTIDFFVYLLDSSVRKWARKIKEAARDAIPRGFFCRYKRDQPKSHS